MPTIVNRFKLTPECLARCRTLVRSTARCGCMDGPENWNSSPIRELSPVISTRILKVFVRAFVWHAVHYFQDQIGLARSCRTSWRRHRPLHVFFNVLANQRPSWGQFWFLRPFFKANYPLLPWGSDCVDLIWPPGILCDVDKPKLDYV